MQLHYLKNNYIKSYIYLLTQAAEANNEALNKSSMYLRSYR